MKTARIWVLIVLCVSVLSSARPVSAENYLGDYAWLRFWNATASWSDHYWNSWQNVGWLGDLWGSGDRWYKLEWTEAMTLTGTRVSTWNQFGPAGTIGEYKLQYWDASEEDESKQWKDIATSFPLMGGVDYNGLSPEKTVSFLTPVTTTAIRVFFPEGSYISDAANKNGAGGGPGVLKLLPIGNLASGLGLDPSDPQFNIFATDRKAGSNDNFLGINPVVTFPGRAIDNGSVSVCMDNDLDADWARVGWYGPTGADNEIIACDLGTSLLIHGVTVYGAVHQPYVSASVNVYITDDLDSWLDLEDRGDPLDIALYTNGVLTTTIDLDTVGRYIILTNPAPRDYFLLQEIAVNATLPVPEPATISLLTLAGLAMLRRRK